MTSTTDLRARCLWFCLSLLTLVVVAQVLRISPLVPSSFLLFLGLCLSMAILWIEKLSKWRASQVFLLVALPYFLFLVVERGSLLDGQVVPLLLVVELLTLGQHAEAARRLSLGIREFREGVEQLSLLSAGEQALPFERWPDLVDAEFEHGRRYDQPLSVIAIQSNDALLDLAVADVQRTMQRRLGLQKLAATLRPSLRRTDLLFEEETTGRLVVVCRATDRSKVASVIKSLGEQCAEKLGLQLKCGSASYPLDALTFEDLVAKAGENISSSAQSSSKLRAVAWQGTDSEAG